MKSNGKITSKTRPPTYVRNPDTVRRLLISRYASGVRPFRELAAVQYFPIPAGTLCAIAKGYPIPIKWYKRLKLLKPIEMDPCPVHNVVHCYNCQTEQVSPKRNGNPRKKRRRVVIDLPPDMEPDELERVRAMSKEERRERLLYDDNI